MSSLGGQVVLTILKAHCIFFDELPATLTQAVKLETVIAGWECLPGESDGEITETILAQVAAGPHGFSACVENFQRVSVVRQFSIHVKY